MNPESEEPMDTQLLQLERELFSLTPVETPRGLATRLHRELMAPVGLADLPAASRVVPFRWQRIVAPAAAAVVVVSVLNRFDNLPAASPGTTPPGFGTAAKSARPPVVEGTGYVLKAEPVFVNPAGWEAMEHQYWITPQMGAAGYPPSRRQGFIAPVAFH